MVLARFVLVVGCFSSFQVISCHFRSFLAGCRLFQAKKTPASTHYLRIMANDLKIAGTQIFNIHMLILS